VPRQPDPELEQRILDAASRLWARGGEKALTMRAVAKAAHTTTPTVYGRYRDRGDILRALRLETRRELFATLSRTRTLSQSVERYIHFALEHSYAYEVLFDGVGKPPSLHEPWPSFNLMRERVASRLGGTPRRHSRLMLAIWSLMHGAVMLIIRGRFEGHLRVQTIHACIERRDRNVWLNPVRNGRLAWCWEKAWRAALAMGTTGIRHRESGNEWLNEEFSVRSSQFRATCERYLLEMYPFWESCPKY
jgi:AcrR family transcriptional regulator